LLGADHSSAIWFAAGTPIGFNKEEESSVFQVSGLASTPSPMPTSTPAANETFGVPQQADEDEKMPEDDDNFPPCEGCGKNRAQTKAHTDNHCARFTCDYCSRKFSATKRHAHRPCYPRAATYNPQEDLA